MYRISSTNDWHNGRKFNSFVEAKDYADKHGNHCIMDVMRDEDNKSTRAIYTGGNTFSKVNVGSYEKNMSPQEFADKLSDECETENIKNQEKADLGNMQFVARNEYEKMMKEHYKKTI